MNSGTTSTELNDMLTNFVNYVDSFYGVNDPLYPLVKDGKPLSKVDILGATEKYLSLCAYYEKQDKNWTSDYKVMVWGMETHLIVRESETFYLKSTTTNLWGNNETIQISNRELRHKDNKSDSHI